MTDAIFELPAGVEHLVVQLGIPIAYPRMNFLEYAFRPRCERDVFSFNLVCRSALESKLNPLIALGRSGSLGMSSMVNKFNADAELLDDLVSRCDEPDFADSLIHSFNVTLERPLDSQRTQSPSKLQCLGGNTNLKY